MINPHESNHVSRLSKTTAALLTIFLLVSSGSALAFRADQHLKAGPLNKATKELETAPARAAKPEQLRAAQSAQSSGLRVEWHRNLGTPLSVRGTNLSVRGPFSGGKGMTSQSGQSHEQRAIIVMDNLARLYSLRDAQAEFRATRMEVDRLGFHHVRMTQLYQGLKVVGGEVVVHFDKEDLAYQVNGDYVADIQVAVQPKLQKEEAVRLALEDLAALIEKEGKLSQDPELVIFARNAEPQLAYELTLATTDSKSGPGSWRYWVSAQDGRILQRYNNVQSINPPTANGTTTTLTGNILSGEGGQSVNVSGWHENTGYYYLWNTNYHWYIYNVATHNYADNSTYAFRPTAAWGTNDPTEVSAARNFDIIQKYYRDVHGRQSFNNASSYAIVNVHEGTNFVNAYWDDIGEEMYIGDGDGYEATSLAVLDVCAHELTHGVDQYSANLTYLDESGALNESFSDIFGACVEFYAQPDGRSSYPAKVAGAADWLLGEDCWLSSLALRDMRNPANPATVGSGYEQPSRYKGSYWYSGTDDNGGVHQNSGPQNFFFYLLCDGGSGINDGKIYSVTGIGITNAEQIAYRALTVYCTANTDYPAARDAWLSAAMDLNPAWVNSVDAAWRSVGVSPVGPVFLSFTLDSDPGWSRDGYWAFGTPAGAGSHNADPTSGYTGENVFGYNLWGDYPNDLTTVDYLTTGALDCSGYIGVSLSFKRWLGVESSSYDHARVQVSNDGVNWVTVWANGDSTIEDTSWKTVSYDISAVANNQPTVYVRWGMGDTDSDISYPGWNIDDIELHGNTMPVGDFPNLTLAHPAGWSDTIVVSSSTNSVIGSTNFASGTPLYVNWAVLNQGTAAAGSGFVSDLYVDGVLKERISTPAGLGIGASVYSTNRYIGTLPDGLHTIIVFADSTNGVAENNEDNNAASISFVVTPANDQCSGAFQVSSAPYTRIQSTAGATSTGDPVLLSSPNLSNGVWYTFTPAANGQVVIDTLGSTFDTVLALYQGTCGSKTLLAYNDDGGYGFTSSMTNSVIAGTSYFVLAGGFDGETGSLQFHISASAPGVLPVVPPVLSGIARALDGSFQFVLSQPSNTRCLIEVASDLKTWTPFTYATPTNGSTIVHDITAGSSNRFYRAKLAP